MPRDERTYITVHDGMPDHPKVEGLSDAAFRLMVEAWCWCSRNRTDGKIVAPSWRKRGTPKARAELIAAGLIEEVSDGVMVHDYTEHQRTAAEIDEIKEKRRQAGSKGGKAKANALALAKQVPTGSEGQLRSRNGNDDDLSTSNDLFDDDGTERLQANEYGDSPVALAKQTASKVVAESETDTEKKTSSSSRTRKRATHIVKDWAPTETDVTWQRAEGISDFIARRELPIFIDHWTSKGEARADWSATWRNWLRRAGSYTTGRAAVPESKYPRASTEW